MKKTELKEIIKECVREVLYEEGVLSEVIAEVAYGLTKAQSLLQENNNKKQEAFLEQQQAEEQESRRKKLLDSKRKMLDAIGKDSMKGVFEGTEPIKSAGVPGQTAVPGVLSGVSPNDSGVNIDSLFGSVGTKWQRLKG